MKNLSFFEAARSIFHFILVVDLAVGTLTFRKLIFDQKILYYLMICVAVEELVTVSLWKLKRNNNFVYHFYAVAELLLLGTLYAAHLKTWIKPVYMRTLFVLFVLFAVLNALFFQSLREFNSNVIMVSSLLLIMLALLYSYKLLHDLDHHPLKQVPMFWINMSVLTYFAGAFLLFNVVNDLVPQPLKERQVVWGVHAVFNIVHYLLYGIALWVTPSKSPG